MIFLFKNYLIVNYLSIKSNYFTDLELALLSNPSWIWTCVQIQVIFGFVFNQVLEEKSSTFTPLQLRIIGPQIFSLHIFIPL